MVWFPLTAALISAICTVVAVRRYLARRRPHELAWSLAFALFTLGAAAEVAGDLVGWSATLARLYYVSGAVLTVGYLGLGSLQLLLGRRFERWFPGVMLILGALGFAFVFTTPVDPGKLDRGWQALVVKGSATLLFTILINSFGTLIVVGGALYSALLGRRRGMPRERVAGLAAIALGTLVVASGGTVYRVLGDHAYLYVTMAPGVAIILAGYLLANRSGTAAASRPMSGVAGARDGVPALDRGSRSDPEPLGTPVQDGTGAREPLPRAPTGTPAAHATAAMPRPLGPGDVPALRALLTETCVVSPVIGALQFRPLEELGALIARADALWLGLEANGELVAVAGAVGGTPPLGRHVARLEVLAVDGSHRGFGLGAALLRAVTAWADDAMGLARLEVAVLRDDTDSRQFYERFGFTVEGVARRGIFWRGAHHDLLILARVRE